MAAQSDANTISSALTSPCYAKQRKTKHNSVIGTIDTNLNR